MNKESWIKKCQHWKKSWPVFQESYNDDSHGIDLYKVIEIMNDNLNEDEPIVTDAGSAFYICNQGFKPKKGQKIICSLSQGEMGAALGIASGVCFARDKKQTIVIQGDGSFNTNPQALAVIKKHNLPIKIFILNNNGYLSIKNSQDKFYEGRRIGTCGDDGIFFPSINKIANAYDIKYCLIKTIKDFNQEIDSILKDEQPYICEIKCKEIQDISPSITASKDESGKYIQNDFSNMHPFLSKEVMEKEFIKD